MSEIKDIDSALNYIAEKFVGLEGLCGVVQFATTPEETAMARSHHGIGRTLRNELGLWQDNALVRFFKNLGIDHADDMSGILLTSFYRKLHGKDFALEGQIEKYKKYWADKEKPNE